MLQVGVNARWLGGTQSQKAGHIRATSEHSWESQVKHFPAHTHISPQLSVEDQTI